MEYSNNGAGSLFTSYEKLIYKQSWFYTKKYNLDFEEVKSQAFLIFCKAIELFQKNFIGKNGKKATFSTFLFNRLKTLNDFCKKERKINDPLIGLSSKIEDQNYNEKLINQITFYQLVNQLSNDSKKVVYQIIHGSFEKPNSIRKRKIGRYRILKECVDCFDWKWDKATRIYNELTNWWIKNELLFLLK